MRPEQRNIAARVVHALLRGANRWPSHRVCKRRLASSWYTLRLLDSASELERWARGAWASSAAIEQLRRSCLGTPPTAVAVAATLLGRRIGGARGSPMWSGLGVPGFWLGGVWVHPAMRGMGVGDGVTALVERRAAALGHTEIFLNVAATNAPAIALYRKRGYVEVQREPWRRSIEEHFARVGHPAPQIVMRKALQGE